MIRKIFKKKKSNQKIDFIMKKYNISSDLLSTNRKMVSKAIFIGIFIGMIPMPMQMLAVILIASVVRFNVAIGVSLVWITNPFTMPFIYYIEYITGNFLLRRDNVENLELTVKWFTDNIGSIFVPIYVGTAFYSIVLSFGFYFLVNWLWIVSVEKEQSIKKK